jgi:hypothetical protein
MKNDLSKLSERNSNLFFKYLESNYIGISAKFPPETWAFYSLKGSILENYRTNNCAESWQKQLKQLLGL